MKWMKSALVMLALGLSFNAFAAVLSDDDEAEYREALLSGDMKIVKKYVESDNTLKEMRFFGWSPVQMAANANQPEVVKYLVSKGVDLNYIQPNAHHSAFHLAALNRSKDMTTLLAKSGANINEKLKGDVSLIRFFRDEGDKEMIDHLTKMGVKDDGCEEKCFY
jgi:ankyrin repeat protein